MKKSLALLHRYTVTVVAAWILIIGSSLFWNIYQERQSIQMMAKKEALSSFKKDEAFRLWIASRVCTWKCYEGEHVKTEVVSPKDGKTYHVSNSPIFHADGSISKLTIFRDITETKKWKNNSSKPRKWKPSAL